ncbi:MAG: tetratricopeptide repeat protein [Deltaproteobacteria bacterium]|nr:tetratricopeptide repeat protein [Deltaproteobacteria bacterium]
MQRLIIISVILMALSAAGHLGAQTADKSQAATRRAAQDYIKHGLILATEGRPDAAVKSFEEAIKLDPQSAEAHSLLGSALAKAGNYRRAEEELRKAVELDPGYGEGYYYLGIFLEERGRKQEAEEAFRRARQCAR